MNLITGLFRSARKRLMTKDEGSFRDVILDLVEKKDEYTDEGIASKVDGLLGMVSDLPSGEEKDKLERFITDFKLVKEQDAETAKKAAEMVSDLYESLDKDSSVDIGAAQEPADADPVDAEPASEPVTQKDSSGIDLEEVYQFIKKRMAEEAAATDGACEEPAKEEKETVVADGGPKVAIVLGNAEARGSLAEMFKKAKGVK